MNYNLLLELTADLGYALATNGAETFRVEESVSRILTAYGVTSEVFAIPNCLIISIETNEGKPMTRMRRIPSISTNMDAIERYSNLSRHICATVPQLSDFERLLTTTDCATDKYPPLMSLLGYFLAAAGFAVFFGGRLPDSLCAGICGVLIGLINSFLCKFKVNTFFTTILTSFLMSAVAYAVSAIGVVAYCDTVIIGALMLLVPGMLFTNAMRDIIFGDTNSGVNRIVQVLLIAAAIALGTGSAWSLLNSFVTIEITPAVLHAPWLQCISAVVACVGFAIVFNVHGKGFILCVLGGGVVWSVYSICSHFGFSDPLCYFIAALASGLYSELMARIRKHPATAYLVISLMPMFPGAGVYYATKFFVQSDMASCAAKGSATIAIAGAIAIGVLTVSTLFRMYSSHQQRKKIPVV